MRVSYCAQFLRRNCLKLDNLGPLIGREASLEARFDVYLAAVVSAMFLAGCVVFAVIRRKRYKEQRRWLRGSGN